MKKQLCCLLALFSFLTVQEAKAIDAGLQGYEAGAFNKMEQSQINNYHLEKSYVQSLDHVTKDESIYDASVEEHIAREGVLYNPHFLLEKINFEGNTAIPTEELEKLGLEVLGEDIFFDELLEVCSKVTNLYHSKGYLTSYATVPPQRIVDGVATIRIIESKVGDMNIEGEKWTREWYLRNIIMGKAGLREGDVFNAKNLQRAMKEINREDYVQVQTEVEREAEGEQNTAITLNVRDRFPVNLGFAYDDYGRSYTGAQRVSFLVGMDNLTGLGDKIYGGTILSDSATGWTAGYSLPVSPYGTRFSFDFTDSHVRLGGWSGFFFSMSIIVGSYEGIELLGISAGEVANPQKAIVKSVKSVLFRILIFYVGAIFVIVTIYPWNELSSVGSPFVSTFAKVGITAAASIINFVVLTAALSGANSGIYSSSRMLFKLSHEGDAPKIFGRLSKRIVPDAAILGISGGILIGFIIDMISATYNHSTADMFVVVFSSSVLPGMIPWFVILLAELRFRRNNKDLMVDHPFKLPLYPFSNYFAFIMLIVIVIFMFINPDTRVSVIVGAAVLILAVAVYLVRHGFKNEKA